MSKIYRITLLFVLMMLIVSCTAPAVEQPTASAIPPTTSPTTTQPTPQVLPEVNIVRHPAADDFSAYYSPITSIPKYDPNSTETWQIDLRSQDLTKLDMTGSLTDLMHATFDSKTQWPLTGKLPSDFDPQKIMEIGKDPGLGIRELHKQGITGTGVAIAIVDQPLLVDHQEHKDRIRLYKEINVLPDSKAAMHGVAVTSIAVGKTIGVAPEADLYYIGSWTGDWEPGTNNFTWNFKYYAQAIHRILELNQSLPEDQKIRVIAMQVGWSPDQAGYEKITAA
jgi:subtilisin family serine protease